MRIIHQDLEMEFMVSYSDSSTARSLRIFEAGDAHREQTVIVTDHQALEYAYEQSLRIKKKSGRDGLNELEQQILLLISKLNIQRSYESDNK